MISDRLKKELLSITEFKQFQEKCKKYNVSFKELGEDGVQHFISLTSPDNGPKNAYEVGDPREAFIEDPIRRAKYVEEKRRQIQQKDSANG